MVFNDLCNLQWHLKPQNSSIFHLLLSNCFVYQMHVMLNASIENVIKPDITSLLCEADSAGRPMMPMRVGWGSRWAVCVFVQQQEAMCPSPSAPRRLSVMVHKCPLLPTHCRVTCCSSEEKHSAAHRTMT